MDHTLPLHIIIDVICNVLLACFKNSKTMLSLAKCSKSTRVVLLVFLLISFGLMCQGRTLPSSLIPVGDSRKQAFSELTKHLVKDIARRQKLIGPSYKPSRLSPGGPNPHHHLHSQSQQFRSEDGKD